MGKRILMAAGAVFAFIGLVHSLQFVYGFLKRPSSATETSGYFVGQQVGQNLKKQGIELPRTQLINGLEDALDGKSRLNPEELIKAQQDFSQLASKKMQELQVNNEAATKKFLEANKANKGWVVTPSGLQYFVRKEGKGKKPSPTSHVQVHYTGTLIDGTKFDSSRDRAGPGEFQVDKVIPGWTEALKLMPEGSQWVIVVPPNLAYGPNGNGPIPPGSALIFEMELMKVVK